MLVDVEKKKALVHDHSSHLSKIGSYGQVKKIKFVVQPLISGMSLETAAEID